MGTTLMTLRLSTGLRVGAACLVVAACALGAGGPASAQQPLAPPPPPAAASPPPAAEAPASTAMTTPTMTGPLVAHPNPFALERGLLWAQEPIVSRGVQVNYTQDPWTLGVSLNDGFYSDAYNWLVGSLAYAPDKQNTFTIVGGGNFDHTSKNAVSCRIADCVIK